MKSSFCQRHPRVLAAVLIHAWICIFLSIGAQAQQAPSQTAPRYTVVMLLPGLTDQRPCAAELEAVQNQLADLPVTVEVAPLGRAITQTDEILEAASHIAAARSAILVFWTPFGEGDVPLDTKDCTTASRVYLFTSDSEGGRFLMRDLGTSQADSETQREALGIIVRSTLRALFLGERMEGTPAPTVISTPPPSNPAPIAPLHLDLLAQYGLWGLSNQIPVNHGARLGLGVSGARFSAGLGWRLNARGKTSWSDVSVVRHSGGPEVFAGLSLGKRVRLAAELAFFVERVDLEVTSAPQSAEVRANAARWVPGLGASLGISVAAGARLRLLAMLGVDAPMERTLYIVKAGGSERLILEGWWMRPTFRVGGLFSVLNLNFRPKVRLDAQ
ncbi:MAG: hypothetical protein MUC50_09465 [Myxococcota bacterium]|nr:hypothetical protein [Myxococcota bacterium]